MITKVVAVAAGLVLILGAAITGAEAQSCPCDADADGSGEIAPGDILAVIDCIAGNCCDCAARAILAQPNACDVNCDGRVDLLDRDAVVCAQPAGQDLPPSQACDTGICLPVAEGACCVDIEGSIVCIDNQTEAVCDGFPGIYHGDGSTCAGDCDEDEQDDMCEASVPPNPLDCPCNADANGTLEITPDDILAVIDCIVGNCCDCAARSVAHQPNGCDVNCDGKVDLLDRDAVICAQPSGLDLPPEEACDTAICEPALIGACCLEVDGTPMCIDGQNEANCVAIGGMYGGDLTLCVGDCSGNGVDDRCDTFIIPTVSGWGLIALALVLLTGGSVVLLRKSVART